MTPADLEAAHRLLFCPPPLGTEQLGQQACTNHRGFFIASQVASARSQTWDPLPLPDQ
jgi:hypothetical protein